VACGAAVRGVLKEVEGVVDLKLDCHQWIMKVAFKPDANVKKFTETMNSKAPFKIAEIRTESDDVKRPDD
jgi:hypothetical protein